MGINFRTIDTVATYVEQSVPQRTKVLCGMKSVLHIQPVKLETDIFSLSYKDKLQDKIINITSDLASESVKNFWQNFNSIKNMLRDVPGKLIGRTKTEKSIYSKLKKRIPNEECLNSLDNFDIKSRVPDLYGTRMILKTGKPEEVDILINNILKNADKNQLQLEYFMNYGERPYLNEVQCNELIHRGAAQVKIAKPSGYVSTHMYFSRPNGDLIELQVRGEKVNKFSEIEHKGYNEITKNINLNEEAKQNYSNYVSQFYNHVRNLELGIPSKAPKAVKKTID